MMIDTDKLPCYENAQRLARLEEGIRSICRKLDEMSDHPCARCQNSEALTRLSTEMRAVKGVGGIVSTILCGLILALAEGWIK